MTLENPIHHMETKGDNSLLMQGMFLLGRREWLSRLAGNKLQMLLVALIAEPHFPLLPNAVGLTEGLQRMCRLIDWAPTLD